MERGDFGAIDIYQLISNSASSMLIPTFLLRSDERCRLCGWKGRLVAVPFGCTFRRVGSFAWTKNTSILGHLNTGTENYRLCPCKTHGNHCVYGKSSRTNRAAISITTDQRGTNGRANCHSLIRKDCLPRLLMSMDDANKWHPRNFSSAQEVRTCCDCTDWMMRPVDLKKGESGRLSRGQRAEMFAPDKVNRISFLLPQDTCPPGAHLHVHANPSTMRVVWTPW